MTVLGNPIFQQYLIAAGSYYLFDIFCRHDHYNDKTKFILTMLSILATIHLQWLGKPEQNIAEMFKEAKDEQAILFLDEADSFFRDRQGMTRSWEVSQINELLQQMERFNDIFICATKLFDQLDQAALRCFAFNIRFKYLKSNQRMGLFA